MRAITKLLSPGLVLLVFVVMLCSLPASLAAQGKQSKLCIAFDIGGRGDLSFNDMAALGGTRR